MSKIVATYDTETKELILTIDGNASPEVERVNFCSISENYDGKEEKYGYFEAEFKKMTQNGVKYRLSAHASKIEEQNVLDQFIRKSLSQK